MRRTRRIIYWRFNDDVLFLYFSTWSRDDRLAVGTRRRARASSIRAKYYSNARDVYRTANRKNQLTNVDSPE